jgi:hypothetical protein
MVSSSIATKRGIPRKGFALCLDNDGYAASLEVGKVYPTLPSTDLVPAGWMRVIDESGEDYLYPCRRFLVLELPPRARRALTAR